MSARRNLRGHLRRFGYDDPPGITVIAKQTLTKNIDFYGEMAGKERPALFFQERESEWLVAMRMEDFMELYHEWELNTANMRGLPFT